MKTLALLCIPASLVWAQQETAPPSFEVASVKVAAPFNPGMGPGPVMRARGCGKPDPALLRCNGASLRMLLMRAYDVKSYQIEGPAWINTETFDVMAKVPEGAPADQIPAMLQALLAERLGARVHKETRVLPAYELSIAKGGPKLKETDSAKLPSLPEPGSALPPPPPRGPGAGPPPLGSMPAGAVMMMINSNGARMVRGNMTIEQLVNDLSNSLDRPVLDKTGLKGTYEIELSYLGDENDGIGRMIASNPPPPRPDGGPGGRGDAQHEQDVNTPTATLPQALQQTLGLKLEPKKSPIEMIVVDSANKVPTEN